MAQLFAGGDDRPSNHPQFLNATFIMGRAPENGSGAVRFVRGLSRPGSRFNLALSIERGVPDVYRIGSALCVGRLPFLEQLVTGQYRPEW